MTGTLNKAIFYVGLLVVFTFLLLCLSSGVTMGQDPKKPEVIKMSDQDTANYRDWLKQRSLDNTAAEAAYHKARATEANFQNFMLKMEKKYKVTEGWELKGEEKLEPYWEKVTKEK